MSLILFLVPSVLVAAAYVLPVGAAPVRDDPEYWRDGRDVAKNAVGRAGSCPSGC